MKEKFVNSSLSFLTKYQECDEVKTKILRYSLEGLYSLIIKISVVLIIAILTNTIKETGLIILFYAGVRTFSYGLHAKSNIACWIITITTYNIIPLLIKSTIIPDIAGYIILAIALISALLWAPADTPKKPLIHKEKRIKCKILTTLFTILYTCIFAFTKSTVIKNTLVYALIIEVIFINPLTYKLTNTKFNNYKYYKKTTV